MGLPTGAFNRASEFKDSFEMHRMRMFNFNKFADDRRHVEPINVDGEVAPTFGPSPKTIEGYSNFGGLIDGEVIFYLLDGKARLDVIVRPFVFFGMRIGIAAHEVHWRSLPGMDGSNSI
jgi:hypothetical protein